MPSDEKVHRLRDKVSDDEEIEATFRRLRQDGHSRLEAARTILDALDVSLSEAKRLLISNETWAEARSAAGLQSASAGNDEESPSGGADENSIPPAPG